jgi:hypothetical protein
VNGNVSEPTNRPPELRPDRPGPPIWTDWVTRRRGRLPLTLSHVLRISGVVCDKTRGATTIRVPSDGFMPRHGRAGSDRPYPGTTRNRLVTTSGNRRLECTGYLAVRNGLGIAADKIRPCLSFLALSTSGMPSGSWTSWISAYSFSVGTGVETSSTWTPLVWTTRSRRAGLTVRSRRDASATSRCPSAG